MHWINTESTLSDCTQKIEHKKSPFSYIALICLLLKHAYLFRLRKRNIPVSCSSWIQIVWAVLWNRSRIWQIYFPKRVWSFILTVCNELRWGLSFSIKLSSGFWSFSQLKVIGGSPWAEHSRLTRSPSFAFMSPLEMLVNIRGPPPWKQKIEEMFEFLI